MLALGPRANDKAHAHGVLSTSGACALSFHLVTSIYNEWTKMLLSILIVNEKTPSMASFIFSLYVDRV